MLLIRQCNKLLIGFVCETVAVAAEDSEGDEEGENVLRRYDEWHRVNIDSINLEQIIKNDQRTTSWVRDRNERKKKEERIV